MQSLEVSGAVGVKRLTSNAVFISSERNVVKEDNILDIRSDFLHVFGSFVIYSSSFKTQHNTYHLLQHPVHLFASHIVSYNPHNEKLSFY